MMSYREVTKADQMKVVVFIGLMIVFNVVTAIALTSSAWPFGLIVWLILCFGGSLFLLVRWHANNTAYRCPTCTSEYEISFFTDFISPHVPNKKYLKCPHCGEKGWAEVLMKAD
jgi:DNA-directed RNA polymerase subunit RPC12/RpoP